MTVDAYLLGNIPAKERTMKSANNTLDDLLHLFALVKSHAGPLSSIPPSVSMADRCLLYKSHIGILRPWLNTPDLA